MARNHTFLAATVLTGLLTFAPTSFAEDSAAAPSDDANSTDTSAVHRAMAKKAAADAASLAIESVTADNKLDLDIRLIGPTSVTIASDR
jgi:hypothetical protein